MPPLCLGRSSSLLLARFSISLSNRKCVPGQFPQCLAAAMAAPGWQGIALLRTVLGVWTRGPEAARECAARLPSLLGSQRRCISCVASQAFSGPRLASASRPNGHSSALDCFLGLSQPDSSLTFHVPAVSMHRGKGLRQICTRP